MNSKQAEDFTREFEVLREHYDLDTFMMLHFVENEDSLSGVFHSHIEKNSARKNRLLIEAMMDHMLATLVHRNGLDLYSAGGALKGIVEEVVESRLKRVRDQAKRTETGLN